MSNEVILPTLKELRRDLRAAVDDIGVEEARYLVDLYYELQNYRIRASNQTGALEKAGEPTAAISLLFAQFEGIENAVKSALDRWSDSEPLAAWAKSHVGIGPVLASGLAAHIDVTRSETAGGVWRFAGLDPTATWGKGEKRPYNARLKVIAWKIGESFSRQRNHPKCWYGQKIVERKAYEDAKNERGDYADQAKAIVKRKGYAKGTGALKTCEEGKLPPTMIESRVRRWAAKLFLAHYWQHGRELAGLAVPDPYPIAHLGHAHKIDAPDPT